jgi:hypothetical protein
MKALISLPQMKKSPNSVANTPSQRPPDPQSYNAPPHISHSKATSAPAIQQKKQYHSHQEENLGHQEKQRTPAHTNRTTHNHRTTKRAHPLICGPSSPHSISSSFLLKREAHPTRAPRASGGARRTHLVSALCPQYSP